MIEEKVAQKIEFEFILQIVLITALGMMVIFNGINAFGSNGFTGLATGIGTVSASEIIPTGVPEVYGKSLGVRYDDVSPNNPRLADATIRKLTEYEDIVLDSVEMKRYIKIAGSISCEYCCGAKSIIFSNGERACGCAHSYAMRGLAKYLIVENGEEFTDDEILSELGKWKVLYFPGIHETKAAVLESKGIDSTDYINLASNKYRGIEKGQQSNGGMVGGC